MPSLLSAFLSKLIDEKSASVIIVDNAKTPCLHLLSPRRRGNSEEIDDYRYGDEHDADEFRPEAARWSVRGACPESAHKTCLLMAPKRQYSDRRLLLTPPTRKESDPDGRKTARYGICPGFASPSRDIPDIDSFPSSTDRSESLVQQALELCDS
jgi:hypothetical protein